MTRGQTVDTTVDTPWTPFTVDTRGGVIYPRVPGLPALLDLAEPVATDPRACLCAHQLKRKDARR